MGRKLRRMGSKIGTNAFGFFIKEQNKGGIYKDLYCLINNEKGTNIYSYTINLRYYQERNNNSMNLVMSERDIYTETIYITKKGQVFRCHLTNSVKLKLKR